MQVSASNAKMDPKNAYKSKWNILFDKTSQWISFKPKVGHTVYPCYACRDMFGSRNSFIDHTNRRGILLKYKCDECSRKFTFYNPCSLLLHAREHFTDKDGEINLENLEVFSLPFGLGGFLPEADIPLLYDVVDNEDGRHATINTRFYSPCEESMGKARTKLIANELVFFYNSPPNDISLVIKQISSNIPRCEFVAFKPADTTTSTGNSSDGDDVIIKEEKDTDVIPYMKDIPETVIVTSAPTSASAPARRTKCPECSEEQTNLPNHFVRDNKPLDGTIKCLECKYVAPTLCSLKAHKRLHKMAAPHVCPECGQDFTQSESLLHHIDNVCFHMTKQVRFRCPGRKCGKIFAQSFTYAAHFPTHIQRFYSCDLCTRSFNTEREFYVHSEEDHAIEKLPIHYYKCTVCHEDDKVYTEDNYKHHVNTHINDRKQCFYVYSCKVCHKHFRSTVTFIAHVQKCDTKAFLPVAPKRFNYVYKIGELCISCGVPTKPNPASGEIICTRCKSNTKNVPAPLLMKVELLKERKGVRCLLCKNVLHINNVCAHFEDGYCRYGRPIVILRGDGSAQPDHVRKKRKKSTTPSSSRKKMATPSSKGELDEPTVFDGVYRCKLCEFTHADRQQFHAHIVTHRYVSTAHQCMECGECFVVRPSLIKHLTYYHQIVDGDKYCRENDCYDREAVKELETSLKRVPGEAAGPVSENQCRVCLKHCTDNVELNKHLRTHGMAFLRNNQPEGS